MITHETHTGALLFGLFMASVLQQGSLNRLHNRWRRLAKCHMAPTLKLPYYANFTSLLPAISDNNTRLLSVGELRRNKEKNNNPVLCIIFQKFCKSALCDIIKGIDDSSMSNPG